ncbi:OprO/OprP family phosphate-selective porin [Pseudohongiella nitratireducens]|uniref:OprO/OprP family phosphate-selective porin n=1 Tax=Pseudohongiella nitratireducens TaxID=1768907 RepID=UPI0030EC0655|tara:strand:+ start:7605 stop:9035 length:1431 start_codon:yes stop_codon:yes gene_type:complete
MAARSLLPFSSPLLFASMSVFSALAFAQTPPALELYVDSETQQIFAEPGAGRVKLGTFQMVEPADALTTVEPSTGLTQPEPAAEVAVGNNGLDVEGNNGFSMRLGGRMHADGSYSSDDNLLKRGTANDYEAVSGTEIRRGRLALRGTAYHDFDYIIEADFGGNKTSVKDLFLTYTGFDPLEITVGNQKHAMSMEIQESSNDIMFNERSLLSALTVPHFDRAIGVNLKSSGNDWSLQSGIYGDGMSSSGGGRDEGYGWGIRGTIAPINTEDRLVHLGANFGHREANEINSLSNSGSTAFRYETTNMSDLYLADTGALTNFESISLGIVEAAAKLGPLSIQSEYGQAKVDQVRVADLEFAAWYVQMGLSLTGESRVYRGSDGEFKRLRQNRLFAPAQGSWGAWELAVRLDQLDLEDGIVLGGRQRRASLNLNGYLNNNVRVLFGYSRAFDIENSPLTTLDGGEPEDIDILSVRTQWTF